MRSLAAAVRTCGKEETSPPRRGVAVKPISPIRDASGGAAGATFAA